MARWRVHLKRSTSSALKFLCLVFLPCTRALQRFQLACVRLLRINSITSFSDKPNCALMASNGVRSSQAISITRSISSCNMLVKQSLVKKVKSVKQKTRLFTGLFKIISKMITLISTLQLLPQFPKFLL